MWVALCDVIVIPTWRTVAVLYFGKIAITSPGTDGLGKVAMTSEAMTFFRTSFSGYVEHVAAFVWLLVFLCLTVLVCVCPPLCLTAYVLYVCCIIWALLPAINLRSFVRYFLHYRYSHSTIRWKLSIICVLCVYRIPSGQAINEINAALHC